MTRKICSFVLIFFLLSAFLCGNALYITAYAAGNCSDSVNIEPAITRQPEDQTAAVGRPLTISLEAEGEDLSYQWFYKKSCANRKNEKDRREKNNKKKY